MTGTRPTLFRTPDRSWGPSCACPDGPTNYDGSCKWSSRPIVQPRSIRRRQCDRWIPEFFYRGRSGNGKKSLLTGVKQITLKLFIFDELSNNYHCNYLSKQLQNVKNHYNIAKKLAGIWQVTYPFLSVRICQIVDSFGVPVFANAKQLRGQKSVFSHDDEVHEESSSGLDHADLTVSHGNQPVTGDRD